MCETAILLNWMASRGMNQANSFFNCYIQLGIQMSLFGRSVSTTMAVLFVSICCLCCSEEREERAKGNMCMPVHPQAFVIPTANPLHALSPSPSFLFITSLFANFILQGSNRALPPVWALSGPLIPVK